MRPRFVTLLLSSSLGREAALGAVLIPRFGTEVVDTVGRDDEGYKGYEGYVGTLLVARLLDDDVEEDEDDEASSCRIRVVQRSRIVLSLAKMGNSRQRVVDAIIF